MNNTSAYAESTNIYVNRYMYILSPLLIQGLGREFGNG
jgi:hypothetical protein